jgi:hypothetical protein
MADHLDFGSAGLRLDEGDHICALYFGAAERDEILLPYLEAGLRAGDKCVCILDNGDATGVIDGIDAGLDASACIESEQLAMVPADEAYTRSGEFSPDQMIEYLDESVGNAIDGGEYPFVRAAGEMCWVLREPPGAAQFIDYESEINRFRSRYPQILMCMYDLERFGGGVVVDLLKTHPKLLLGGVLIDNPHALTPDEFRGRA